MNLSATFGTEISGYSDAFWGGVSEDGRSITL